MDEREKIIRLWFDMWLTQQDLGIDGIFLDDVIYIESWGPKYENRQTVKHWFNEWNTRGKVLTWDIKQFFHKDNQTIVEWYFKNKMNGGKVEAFDGISLLVWTADNKIKVVKEFGCNCNNYNPYKESETPLFRNEKVNWF
ncbi:nuclear transport factor 2 family protein [[Pasteurella] aerogenes]